MSDGDGTLQWVAVHTAGAMRPLEVAFSDADAFRVLLLELGWDAPGLPPSYTAVADKAVTAGEALAALTAEAGIDEVVGVITKAGDVYRAVRALDEAPAGLDPAEFLPELGRRLLEYLIGRQLLVEAPVWFATFQALGVIVLEDTPETPGRPAFTRLRFDWDQIPEILSDPGLIPARLYGWGTDDLKFESLAQILGQFVAALGLPTSLDRVSPALAAALQAGATAPTRPSHRALTAVLFDVPVDDSVIEVGLMLAELPAEGSALPGMILLPLVPDGMSEHVDLTDGLGFDVRAQTDLAAQLGVVVRPGEVFVRYPFAPGQTLPSAGFGVTLAYAPETVKFVFGQPGKTRLELAKASIGLAVDVKAGDLELKAAAGVQALALVVSPEDTDSFLGAVLGGKEVRIDLKFGANWSSRTGLDVLAGGGFAVSLYPHLDIGPLRFDRVDLALHLEAGSGATPAIAARAATSFSGAIGPIAFVVDRLGAELPVTFADGNAGPFDVRLRPLWPTGLGLTIDAGPVTGGGFVQLDPDKGRYVGVLELDIFDIGLSAIGILDTKDVAGHDLPAPGYSLLLLIAVDLPPIQLGFGFTLIGVGGLAAINRRMDVAALLAGARTGVLDSLLFPADPIRDAPVIVSNLSTIFPIAMGRYVFGPMARIGWGTPKLVDIELAIVLEVPDPKILALLGRASVRVPEDVAILDLNVDVVGIVDFAKKLLSIDASLRDSRIGAFALSGDMAFRLSYGSDPNVTLAVGGLNPHFTPTPGFPALRRVTVAVGDGDNPRLTVEGYVALTSNSLQFGAKAELYASAGGFNVRGWLSFDALFIYQPFSFEFDFSVGMSLNHGSSRIAGVTVDGTITGPLPFHVKGRATLSLLFFDISVPFDKSFGARRDGGLLAPFDPWGLLATALASAESWSSELESRAVVAAATLRAPDDMPGLPLLHPMGVAVMRQKAVPLDRVLERFGQYEISGPNRFDIKEIILGDNPTDAWHVVTDHFAPGDFEVLSDTDRLSRDSFEEMDAGVRVGTDTVGVAMPTMKVANVEYETKLIDAPWRSRPGDRFVLRLELQMARLATGAKGRSALLAQGRTRFARDVDRAPSVVLDPQLYSVATTDTLSADQAIAAGVSRGAAYRAMKFAAGAAASLQVVPDHELDV